MEVLPLIEKHLRGGKPYKEIAYLLNMEPDAIRKIIQRSQHLQDVIDELGERRYPRHIKLKSVG